MAMNERQTEAVYATEPTVLVSAGAGSGKTRVLTARYLDLLTRKDNRVPMDRILTLTFTRKAAQEMRERIAAGLEERGLGHLRPELMRAPIGTIHGFCERVLRERALQAGIDPNFRVLDEAEAHTLQENAMDGVFARFWEGTQQEREEIVRLLLDYPHGEIRSALLGVYRDARTRGLDLANLAPVPPSSMASAEAELYRCIEDLLALPGTTNWQQSLRAAEEAYAELRATIAGVGEFSWEIHDKIAACLKPLTPPGGPKGTAKAARDAIKAAMEGWLAAYLDLAAAPYLSAFGTLLRHLDELYKEAKDSQGLLDFSDMLLITRDLLRDEDGDARQYYRTKFRQVMVDEFQDTNPLQFELIRAFQGDGHLFMVGDVKQSIYRFIGSDVSVFLAQEDSVAGLGDAGHRIPMHVNYRTRPEVLAPLNALFHRLWTAADGTPAGQFAFEPLDAGKTFIAKAQPALEIALWPDDQGDTAELRDREAQWIARRILQLTGRLGEPLQVTGTDGAPRSADFGDVILLFRASSDIPRYETALREAGVPYYVVSGRGFYQAREVQDLMYLLAVLENPCDDFALAVVLRSPLVGVSDDTLYWLSRAWEGWEVGQPYSGETRTDPRYGRLWENIGRVETLPTLPAGERETLVRFRQLVLSLQDELPAGQPLDLFDRILEETGYAVLLLAMEDGEQRFANVQKLREVAAAFQARGIFDITDFRRYLSQLEELAPREPSAPLDTEGSQVVRLMTIHASKGLEAPVIFLADMGREPSRTTASFLLSGDRLACKLSLGEGEWAQPAGYRAALDAMMGEERREAERLLYVALTRAQEHLLCSGMVKYKPESGRYSDLLAGLLGLTGDGADRDLLLEYGGQAYPARVWSLETLEDVRTMPTPACEPTLLEQYRPQVLAAAPLPIGTAEVEPYERLIANLQPLPPARRDGPLRVGVNRVICYHTCPRQYWFRYVLRREDGFTPGFVTAEGELPPAVAIDDDPRQHADGTDFGILLHGVLQRAPLGDDLLSHAGPLLEEIARDHNINIGDGDRQAMATQLSRLMGLPIYAQLQAASELHRELRFLTSVGGIYLPGIIDVLAKTDGRWWVLDYKTGRPSAGHTRQVWLYALGVQRALGATPDRVALVYLDSDVTHAVREEIVTQGMLDDAHRMVSAVGDGIRHAQYVPTPGRHCHRCPFASGCPAANQEAPSE